MFDLNEGKVILIRSKFLPIVDAKLAVYKKFKKLTKLKKFKKFKGKQKIFLQHIYDEIDEVAKFIAYQKLSSYCGFINSTIKALTVDLHTIINESSEKSWTPEKVRQLCFDVFQKTKCETVGYLSTLRYKLCIW